MFNWRTIHHIKLPCPKALSHLKLQVWNVQWKPDDCIAEANIPLNGFFWKAVDAYQKDPSKQENWVHNLETQWVTLKNPKNSDTGKVQLSIELLPKVIADKDQYIAAAGEDGWEVNKNSNARILAPPDRPESSFKWYRLDRQIGTRFGNAYRRYKYQLWASWALSGAGVAFSFYWSQQ